MTSGLHAFESPNRSELMAFPPNWKITVLSLSYTEWTGLQQTVGGNWTIPFREGSFRMSQLDTVIF